MMVKIQKKQDLTCLCFGCACRCGGHRPGVLCLPASHPFLWPNKLCSNHQPCSTIRCPGPSTRESSGRWKTAVFGPFDSHFQVSNTYGYFYTCSHSILNLSTICFMKNCSTSVRHTRLLNWQLKKEWISSWDDLIHFVHSKDLFLSGNYTWLQWVSVWTVGRHNLSPVFIGMLADMP